MCIYNTEFYIEIFMRLPVRGKPVLRALLLLPSLSSGVGARRVTFEKGSCPEWYVITVFGLVNCARPAPTFHEQRPENRRNRSREACVPRQSDVRQSNVGIRFKINLHCDLPKHRGHNISLPRCRYTRKFFRITIPRDWCKSIWDYRRQVQFTFDRGQMK